MVVSEASLGDCSDAASPFRAMSTLVLDLIRRRGGVLRERFRCDVSRAVGVSMLAHGSTVKNLGDYIDLALALFLRIYHVEREFV